MKSASKSRPTSPAPAARTGAARIVEIRPQGRARWALALDDGRAIRLDAAAAQSAGIRVGGRWDARAAARVDEAVEDLALFIRAMRILARGGAPTRAALAARLGRGASARRAIATLAKDGWIA